jgi:cell division protein FtsI (penicillin-binding protein 3)
MSKTQRTRKSKKANAPLVAERGHRVRLRLLALAILTVMGVISTRVVQFQLDPDLRFTEEDLKHIGKKQIERPRGSIYDVNGRVLATNRDVPSLSVNPSRVEEPEKLARYLAPRLQMDYDDIYERVTRRSSDSGNLMKFVSLKRRMSDEEFALFGSIEDSPEPKALHLQPESLRFYPEKELAAQVLGFSNREGRGAEGIEAKFDSYLFSQAGEMEMRVDRERRALGTDTSNYRAPTGGDDVILTINSQLQYTLEQELDRAMEQHNATRSMGLLMDPDTGAILAMATRPAFDPNDYNALDPEFRRNRVVTDFFEPGSAFKIVTAAAALELGLVTKETPIDCMGGSFNPYGKRISDTHHANVLPFSETFAQSSNVAVIKVAALLGPERLEHWIRRFGFGSRTGLEVQLESAGYFRSQKNWSRLSMGSLPMGQEIGVSMPQLAQAFSVIANGGHTVRPHLVDRVVSQDGEVTYAFDEGERKRVLSEETAAIMRELAHQVVTSDEGTGKRAAIQEYRVGGKTGTAQIADPVNGGYYKDRYTTVFAGFAPVNDPKITAVIVVQEPMIRNHYGGYVCGPVFREVVREALVKMHAPLDPMDPEFFRKNKQFFPDLEKIADADTSIFREDLDIFEPSMMDESVDRLELVVAKVDTSVQGKRLPSFVGLTKRQAKLKALDLGIKWDPQGAGRVLRQEPVAGTLLNDVQVCKLVFGHYVDPSDDA